MAATSRQKVVLFGATGYVGRMIAKEFLGRGSAVVGISRSGGPPPTTSSHSSSSSSSLSMEEIYRIEWHKADSTKPKDYVEQMRGADAVVTSIGMLPFGVSEEICYKENSETNIIPGRTAMELGIDRFVCVGASLGLVDTFVPGIKPYVEGKLAVENFAKHEFAKDRIAVVVKPSGVSGSRSVGNVTLPLYLVMDPLTLILRRFGGKVGLENAPVRIERVAKAVVDAALSRDERFSRGDGYVEISNEELLTNSDYDF